MPRKIGIDLGTANVLVYVKGKGIVLSEPSVVALSTKDGRVRAVLVETPPELSSDIIDKGMVMTGGGAMLRRINELLTQVTSVPCYVADQPANCVAIGTGLALENIDILRDSLSGDELS
jgi:actin-like ATPase involved in cell morphogenesis